MKCSSGITLLTLGSLLLLSALPHVNAQDLVQYNPMGVQELSVPLVPASVAPFIDASSLTQTGMGDWFNNNSWPVGYITNSPTIDVSEYLTFTAGSNDGSEIRLTDLLYDKVSVAGNGATEASLRTSLDGFTADIATISVNPAGVQSLDFSLSSLPLVSGPVDFRIYFYGALSTPDDFDGLLGTARGGNGLQLEGAVATPEPGSATLFISGGMVGFAYALRRRRK